MRLLRAGIPEKSAEDVALEKIAVQTIHRQFHDADEANLLEERDMHVFDCWPLTDPLHLVCCNACKKPIKASQYAAHAERCRSINLAEDTVLELDGGFGHKKPPRKGRKKFQADQGREQEKSESIGGDILTPAASNLDDQNGMVCSPSVEAQRTPVSVDHGATRDASVIRNGGVPYPLATKIYYSQGSHRLRRELGHLYHKISPKEHGHDSVCAQLKQGEESLSSQAPYHSKTLHETHNGGFSQAKKEAYSPAAVGNSDRISGQSSELFLATSGGVPSTAGIPSQFQENGSLRPGTLATRSVTLMKSSYQSTSYPYPENSGTALSTIRQGSGSVPVG